MSLSSANPPAAGPRIALSSENLPAVRAIITFAAGRGGRVGGKPNNNCAPDRLVAATGEFGRTARTPMLWIYIENDTFFGPDLSRRMHEAYTGAGGNAEYHLLPPFGSDGHFLVTSPDSIPLWAPVGRAVPRQARMKPTPTTMEAKDDKAAVPPIPRPIKLVDSTAGPDAAGFRHGDCVRATAREAGRQPTKRKSCRPGVRVTRPARGKRDQIFRLAQVLLQDAWNEHGVPDIDQRVPSRRASPRSAST